VLLLCRVVILERQVADRDAQLDALRERLDQAHGESSNADALKHDAATQLAASEQRERNLQARVGHLQNQLNALMREREGLLETVVAERSTREAEVMKVRDARFAASSANSRARGARSSVRLVEHQLADSRAEAARLRTALENADGSAGAAVIAAADSRSAAAVADAAAAAATRRAAALQRQLAAQRDAHAAALADAAAAGDAADEARRRAAALAADLHRADARTAAATAHAAALKSALSAVESTANELRAALRDRTAAAGVMSMEAAALVRGLESQVGGLSGRLHALEGQLASADTALACAHEESARIAESRDAAVASAASLDAAASRLKVQLEDARRAGNVQRGLAAEREAALETLRVEVAEIVSRYEGLQGQGKSLEQRDATSQAATAALRSEVACLQATLAEKDADAVVLQEAQMAATAALRDARADAAAAEERSNMLRRQVAAMQRQLRVREGALESAQGDAEVARADALTLGGAAEESIAEAARLKATVRVLESQKRNLEVARARHDEAAAAAAATVADARQAVMTEQDRAHAALAGASGAAEEAAALKRQLAGVMAAYGKQVGAAEAAAEGAAGLREAVLSHQDELRRATAALAAAEGRGERLVEENSMLSQRVGELRGRLQALDGELAATRIAAVEAGGMERAVHTRAAEAAATSAARVHTLERQVEAATERLEVCPCQLACLLALSLTSGTVHSIIFHEVLYDSEDTLMAVCMAIPEMW
jgi:chromosome segregation ATPase